MAITALVLGIISILTSFMPFINNGTFFLALIGLVFAIIGIVSIKNKKKKGKGLAIAGIVLNALAIVFVIASQSMYSSAFDEAINGPSATVVATTESAAADPDIQALPLGSIIETTDGLSVRVDSFSTGLKSYNGKAMTSITVTYTNNGKKEADFNVYDWKGQDASGAQRSTGYYSKAKNELSSGSLAPGGSVTGNVYFEGTLTQVNYYGSVLADEPIASWLLKK